MRAPVDLTDPPANQPDYFHRVLRERKECDATNRGGKAG